MIKYLDYITKELNKIEVKEIAEFLIAEVNLYKEYWKKYSSDNIPNPHYQGKGDLYYNTHNFHFQTGETVTISWDIEQLYKIAQAAPIYYASLSEFEELLHDDLDATKEELLRINDIVKVEHNHKHTPLLLIYFKPTNSTILVDGRHRYIEHKKFKPSEKIPFYYLSDEICFTNILLRRQLLAYIIMHNIEVINEFLEGKGEFERMINIKACMKC